MSRPGVPKRGTVEYRVVWQRPSMAKPKSKLFQMLDAAEAYAWFLKSTEGRRRVREGPFGKDVEDEPMEPLSLIRIDYRETGAWRNPEWDGWNAPNVPKPGA